MHMTSSREDLFVIYVNNRVADRYLHLCSLISDLMVLLHRM